MQRLVARALLVSGDISQFATNAVRSVKMGGPSLIKNGTLIMIIVATLITTLLEEEAFIIGGYYYQ